MSKAFIKKTKPHIWQLFWHEFDLPYFLEGNEVPRKCDTNIWNFNHSWKKETKISKNENRNAHLRGEVSKIAKNYLLISNQIRTFQFIAESFLFCSKLGQKHHCPNKVRPRYIQKGSIFARVTKHIFARTHKENEKG